MEWEDYIASEDRYQELNALCEEMVKFICNLIGIEPREKVEESIKLIEKYVYKNTSCGAWANVPMDDDLVRIKLGSIVEGVEVCCQSHTLIWPFTEEEFWKALKEIESEANEIWNQTHGCKACWGGNPDMDDASEYGMRPVDPNCPECKSSGIVI